MTREIVLTRSDLSSIDEISELIFSCGQKGDKDMANVYGRLCDLFAENVKRLNLDEDILNLSRFAVGMAMEVSEFLLARGSRFSDARHWEWRPVTVKINGANAGRSDVRSWEKQAACMIDVLLHQLKSDELFREGADRLINYQELNQLWTAADEPDIDV